MESNFLEIYNNCKFRTDSYTPPIEPNDYITKSTAWLDFLNNNKVKGGYYISELIQDCTRSLSYTYASCAGVSYNDCWVGFEDYKYRSDSVRYLTVPMFSLRGPHLGLAIIKVLEEYFDTPFFDIPLIATINTDFESIIETGITKLIKGQNYFGYYLKNSWFKDRKRKINIKEFRVCDVKPTGERYWPGDFVVDIEDIKSGKRYIASDWNICLSKEHAKERLNLLAENWKESDVSELKQLEQEAANLELQIKHIKSRKVLIKNRLDNFDTEIKKILDI